MPTTAIANPTLGFDSELIRKYDTLGPRYTSYPSADRFTEAFTAEDLVGALLGRHGGPGAQQPLSLYVHLPFCNTICYYCACNKVITKDHGRSAKYIRYLAREADILSALTDSDATVSQLHWGGGTPTFLAAEEMKTLTRILRKRFAFSADADCAIEVDPRKVDADTVALLAELGFNRMSLGVQDFDRQVQQAVNRTQTEEETLAVLDAARANGFRSINIDLIYGLPKQTPPGFATTLSKVVAAAPDRIALYNYAHVPHLFKPQRRINEAELPAAKDKLKILESAIAMLTQAGYIYIGMDHFAKPDDELAVAQRKGKLQRNFQGYSTHADCDLLALGISAIGKVGTTYSQNVRTLDEYYDRLDAGALPAFRGWQLSADDVLRREVIHDVMCHGALSFSSIESCHGIAFSDYFAIELDALKPLVVDGLVTLTDDSTPGDVARETDGAQRSDGVRPLPARARERSRYSRVI